MICNANALVDPKEFKVTQIPSKDDAEFHQWVASVVAKYPQLLGSFSDLRECWDTYHPAQGQTNANPKNRK